MPNRFTVIQPGTDPAQQIAMINKNFAELDSENVKKLLYDTTGTPSIFLGVDGAGASVIKVAKAGFDVTTATNAQLAFNSAQNTFKVVQTGTVQVSKPAGSSFGTSGNIPHNLGYTPAIIGFYDSGTNIYTLPLYTFNLSGADSGKITDAYGAGYATSTIFGFDFSCSSLSGLLASSYTYNVKYYLLQETAN